MARNCAALVMACGARRRDCPDELEAELGLPFSDDESFAEVDTLGGLVFAIAGRVPERGEMIGYDAKNGREIEFVIRDSDPAASKHSTLKCPLVREPIGLVFHQ